MMYTYITLNGYIYDILQNGDDEQNKRSRFKAI